MEEIWKNIKEFEDYQISNMGRVKSLKFNKQKILKLDETSDGYLTIRLLKNNIIKHIGVHRLVAQAFIPNPNNYPQVNHIDENKHNNCVENLEWCTQEYNMHYGNRTKKMCKEVYQYDLNGNFVKKWESVAQAKKELKIRHISECCNGQMLTAGGFVWNYDNVFKPIIYKSKKRVVKQYDLNGIFLKQWDSIAKVEKVLGFNNRNICACCRHKRPTAYGFIWKYANEK